MKSAKSKRRSKLTQHPLADGKLLAAEQRLLEVCTIGSELLLASERPNEGTDDNRIRAGFIRYLALCSDDDAFIHEHGIRIKGAWVEGDLDLENCRVPVELTLTLSRVNGSIIIRDADLFFLGLTGCAVNGISADRVHCRTMRLNEGFHATDTVGLTRAHIGGNLVCQGGKFDGGSDGLALQIDGAEIEGNVYLDEGFSAKGRVSLSKAKVAGDLVCEGGSFQGGIRKRPDGSEVRTALYCDLIDVRGDVFLNRERSAPKDANKQFHALGVVNFDSARIGGGVYCGGGRFEGPKEGNALRFVGSEIKGDVFLTDGFSANSAVNFSKANISGGLICSGGQFEGAKSQEALVGDQAVIGRNLSLNDSFRAKGIVRFQRVTVGGDLSCSDGIFDQGGSKLEIEHSEIKGYFRWDNSTSKSMPPVSLQATHVGTLIYDATSWEQSGALVLDGFRYDRILGIAWADKDGRIVKDSIDVNSLINWLKKQRSQDWNEDFRPQPWEQLVKVLREMGHDDAARAVAIEKQRLLESLLYRRARKRRSEVKARVLELLKSSSGGRKNNSPQSIRALRAAFSSYVRSFFAALWQKLYGRAAQYGYRPTLLIVWTAYFLTMFAVLFKIAAMAGVMAPTDRVVLKEMGEAGTACDPINGGNWTTCPALRKIGYAQFDPIIYSLDLIFPVISTQQTKEWAPLTARSSNYWPTGLFFWLLARIENLMGWILGLTFVAIVSGLVKKD
jgi:hypothetical protein